MSLQSLEFIGTSVSNWSDNNFWIFIKDVPNCGWAMINIAPNSLNLTFSSSGYLYPQRVDFISKLSTNTFNVKDDVARQFFS